MYKTIIFILPKSGSPDLIPHQEYVHLVRGDASAPKYAKQQVRIADWYVKMDGNRPVEIENETYGLLNFDATGHVTWPSEAAHGATMAGNPLPENSEAHVWLPTLEEKATLHEMVFQSKFHHG